MPRTTVTEYKGLRLYFEEERHSYTDSQGVRYQSVTGLVAKQFEPFDADAVSKKLAAKRGVNPEEIKKEWEAQRDRGTWLHSVCENMLKGEMWPPAANADEADEIWGAQKMVQYVRALCPDGVEAEKVIFSPDWRVAGTIDILGQADEKKWVIGDWKRVSVLRHEGFGGKMGITEAAQNIPDCNFGHYSLQMAMYEAILRHEGMIPEDAEVERMLFVYTELSHNWAIVRCETGLEEAYKILDAARRRETIDATTEVHDERQVGQAT